MAQKPEWSDAGNSSEEMQKLIDQTKERIEFVWIAGYDISGKKLYGDSNAPDSIAGKEYYDYLVITQNLTVGSPEYCRMGSGSSVWECRFLTARARFSPI